MENMCYLVALWLWFCPLTYIYIYKKKTVHIHNFSTVMAMTSQYMYSVVIPKMEWESTEGNVSLL